MGIFSKSPPGTQFNDADREMIQEIDRLQKKIISLSQKVALVEEHSSEYYQVLFDHGWSKVIERASKMEEVSAEIDRCLKERRFSDALLVVRFVESGINPEDARDREKICKRFGELACWERETDKLILAVVSELSKAAQNTKNLGINRAHKRKATLTAVQEIQRLLSDRKEKKATLEEW